MKPATLAERLAAVGVVPVVEIDDAADAVPLADALLAGGIAAIEVTFRTDAAETAVAAIARERPRMLVAAGTLLDAREVEAAAAAGAAFGVSPGTSAAVLDAARRAGLRFVPGVSTASEVQRALELGAGVLKFFPAEACGGAAGLKALQAPFAHRGVRFVPTGGIGEAQAPAYLALPAVVAVGGSWLAPRGDIADGRWEAIRERAAAAAALVRAPRGLGATAS